MASISEKISLFLGEQRELIRDFYHLDYWDDHSLMEGFVEAADGASEMIEDSSRGNSSFVQASAGAGMGLATLLGGIPIALNEWGIQTVREVPKGPGPALYKFVEVPVTGIVQGISHVGNSLSNWMNGSLNHQGSFSIAQEVTSVLGTAILIGSGAKNITNGTGKFLGEMKTAASEMSVATFNNGMATASATVGVGLAGGSDLLAGVVLMSASSRTSSSGGSSRGKSLPSHDKLAEVLEKHGGDRVAAAEELGVEPNAIRQRIFHAGEDSPLARFKPPPSDKKLADVLEKHGGDVNQAAEALNCPVVGITVRIRDAQPTSPLAPFKPKVVTDWEIVEALGKHKGKVADAAAELGIHPNAIHVKMSQNGPLSSLKLTDVAIARQMEKNGGKKRVAAKHLDIKKSTLEKRISEAAPDSPLAAYKVAKVTDEQLASALSKHGGNHIKAAEECGLHPTQIGPRLAKAEPGSPLSSFKITDQQIAASLEKHGGDFKRTANELGVTKGAIQHQIDIAPAGSPLAEFSRPAVEKRLGKAFIESGGDFPKAVEKAGISEIRAFLYTNAAQPGTPLYPVKLTLDQQAYTALSKHGGSISAAAKELGWNWETLRKRIERAEAGEPLAQFKK